MRIKPNIFYLIVGIIALIEVGIFWVSIELDNPILIQAAVLIGIIVIYLAKRKVETIIEDERTQFIAQKAALRTLEVFWVIFFVMSLGSIVMGMNRPLHFRPPVFPGSQGSPPSDIEVNLPLVGPETFGRFGFVQLGLLCLMIFLYIGFRIYYGRKYGASEADEE
ncbi:MAG: hypothetical protein A4E35_01423 [Methanoregula sp. PtaU1.Bin051]|nr:MAG: hypothetical protein A4E35_01423 [Methanoregula sp. PtaU1.Bin051]